MNENNVHQNLSPHASFLRHFVTVLFKRMRIIVSVFLIVVVTVAAFTFLSSPIFRSSGKILIEKEDSSDRALLFRLNLQRNIGRYDWIKSEIEILTSHPVVSQVLRELGSDDLAAGENHFDSEDPKFERALKKFLRKLKAENSRNTNVIELSYESKDAQLAAATVNRVIQLYQDHRSKIYAESENYEFFEEQMSVVEAKLSELQQRLSNYKNEEEILSPDTQGEILLTKLADYEKTLTDVQTTRIGREAKLSVIMKQLRQEQSLVTIPSTDVSDSPSREKYIAKVKGELLEMEIQRDRLLQLFKPNYREIVQIEKQIDATKELIKNEIREIVEQEKTAIQALRAEERVLQTSIARINKKIKRFAKKEYELAQLNRGIDDNQEVYSMLLKQREEARLSRAKLQGGVRIEIVSPAVVPWLPAKPQKLLNIVLGILLGIFTGVGLAFLVEYNDQSIHTPEEMENLMGLYVLGSVSEITPKRLKASKLVV